MSVRIVTFQVANQMLAIPIDKVREVIRYVPVVEAPQWSGLLHGIIHVRNIIIPVLDLRLILSNAPIQNNTKTRIIIVDMFERVVGLIVDQVNDILPLSSEQLIPRSSIIWNNQSSILAGVAKIDNLLFLVLDIDYLLQEEEQKIFKEICLSLSQ